MCTSINGVIQHQFDASTLWSGAFKIPWHDREFGRRMLREHLSQDHQLASRKAEMIEGQVEWIDQHTGAGTSRNLLDLGCGPGLYARAFAERGFEYHGIDISPVSIEYACEQFADAGTFAAADIRDAEFGTDRDVVSFIYGEFNVFSEADERRILRKAWDALKPGGHLLIEVQTYDAVKGVGSLPPSWYRGGAGVSGLFSEQPHLVLMENHWVEEAETAVQEFFVLHGGSESEMQVYRNTSSAITDDVMAAMLRESGFADVAFPSDWPVPDEALRLVVARKQR